MKYTMPAIIFAGGKSSRMGRDKALLPFAGYTTLSEYQYRRLKHYFQHVYLSTKEEKFHFDAMLIFDRYDINSPLVGLVSLFETLNTEEVFILSVDAPFVNKVVIDRLIETKREHYDAVVAKTSQGLQPLCGIYKRTILPAAKMALKAKNHKLGALLQAVKSRTLLFEDEQLFTNLNHPGDYEKAYQDAILST